jgi:hypothetical protein
MSSGRIVVMSRSSSTRSALYPGFSTPRVRSAKTAKAFPAV